MNAKALLVALISLIAIALYWSPVPLRFGDYILGGYPWLAPEGSKTGMILLGIVLTAAFLSLTALMFYVASRSGEALGNPQPESAEELSW